MWRKIVVLFAVVAICRSQNPNSGINSRKPCYKYGTFYHVLYGGFLHYITFILIKLKVAFFIGTLLTVFIVAGKIFALVKYIEHTKVTEDHKAEKIYIPTRTHPVDDHHEPISYLPPTNEYSSSYFPGVTLDQLPPNAGIGENQYYDSPPPYVHSRSNGGGYYNLLNLIFRKLPLTEIAFNAMKLSTSECRRKFVCKTDYNAKHSSILSKTLYYIRDDYYNKYRTNSTVRSLAECDRLYKKCKVDI